MAASIYSLLAHELDISEERARTLLHAMVEEIRTRAIRGDGVRIQDFGTFERDNGQIRFIPDPSLSQVVNHRFEGLQPETLYLEEPADSTPPPYPRPSDPEESGLDSETEFEDADAETEDASETDELSHESPASEEPSLPADRKKTPQSEESSSENMTGGEAAMETFPKGTDEPSEEAADEPDVEVTEQEPEPAEEQTEPEPVETRDETREASPEEPTADEAEEDDHEPNEDSFYPMLNRLIGVEKADDDSHETSPAIGHPLADIRAVQSTEGADQPGEPTSSGSHQQSESDDRVSDADSSPEAQNSFEAFFESAYSAKSFQDESSSPLESTSHSSYGSGQDSSSFRRSARSSQGSVGSSNGQRIFAGIVVLLLIGVSIWFLLGRMGPVDESGELPPANESYTSQGQSSSGSAPTDNPQMRSQRSDDSQTQGGDRQPPSETSSAQSDASSSETSSADQNDVSSEGIDAAAGGWTLVVRSRASRESAMQWLNEHREQFTDLGFQVDVLQGRSDGRTWYRVAVGQFSSLDELRSALNQHTGIFPRDAWPLRLSS